jgi:hypothetical protein
MTAITIPAGTTVRQTIEMTLTPDIETYVRVPMTVTLSATPSPTGAAYTYRSGNRVYRVAAAAVEVVR